MSVITGQISITKWGTGEVKNSWLCRDYEKGDEYQILSLYRQVSGREMSLAFWRWRYLENPFGQGMIKLLFDGDKLIGHRGAIPMVVSVQEMPLPAALILNTLTHPDFRRFGVSTYLAAALYDEAAQRGIKFVYNFPNPNSYPLYLRIKDWRVLDQRSVYQKRLESQSTSRIRKNSNIYQVEEFDEGVNALWDRVEQDYHVIVPRTKEFLNWRFVKNPAIVYYKYAFISSQREVLGYIVLKTYLDEYGTKGHIIDMLSIEDTGIVKELLECADDHFRRSKIQHISCWMPEHSFYADIFKREGYTRESMETHFGLRILDKQDSLLRQVEHIRHWYLTMGDSDVF